MSDGLLHQLVEGAQTLIAALAPAALGSAVAQAYQRGLSLRDRLVQWSVGILVSHYVTLGVAAVLQLGPFVGQALGFVLGMIAFQAAPRFMAASTDALAGVPNRIIDFLPKPKDPRP